MRVQTHSNRISHPTAVCIVMRTYSDFLFIVISVFLVS